jgi:hypothetical protein
LIARNAAGPSSISPANVTDVPIATRGNFRPVKHQIVPFLAHPKLPDGEEGLAARLTEPSWENGALGFCWSLFLCDLLSVWTEHQGMITLGWHERSY